jgi:hypothetical protein
MTFCAIFDGVLATLFLGATVMMMRPPKKKRRRKKRKKRTAAVAVTVVDSIPMDEYPVYKTCSVGSSAVPYKVSGR